MSKYTATKLARTFEEKKVGKGKNKKTVIVRRAKPLPVGHFRVMILRSKKGEKKRHILEAAKQKISKMGGKFLYMNGKKNMCHYLTKTGKRVAAPIYLGRV